MKIEKNIASERLRPFIKNYVIIESRDELINRVLPDTGFAMAFRFKGHISYVTEPYRIALPSTLISGPRKSVRLINYAPQTAAIIVVFKETGVSAFFKQPLYELFEESASLSSFFSPSEISIVEERLAEAENNRVRISLIEQFLYSKLIDQKPDLLVRAAINIINTNNGMLRIRALADSLHISHDAFEKRFRKVTGSTPKHFSSTVRMKSIIRQNPESSSLLDLALGNGYYDQSHFNKDFKIFTGLTPGDFFKSASYW